jgi:hypothetical protein
MARFSTNGHFRITPRNLFSSSTNLKLPLGLQARFKATISDIEIDQRGYRDIGKMEYKYGMPTPPLSRQPSQKSKSVSGSWAIELTRSDLTTTYPQITPDQDLLRLKYHLDQLPTTLLKHVHLQRVRRQNPNLFFAALADDINAL